MDLEESMFADQVFVNGRILTLDSADRVASAFAVQGDRFCAVGSSDEVSKCAGPNIKVTNLQQHTVVPGFIESHSHLSLYSMTLLQANCRTPPNRTIDEVKVTLKKMRETIGPGEWIKGWGFDDTLIAEKRHLTRADLDEALPDVPAFISHASGHLAYVNSKALTIAAIGPDTPQPSGGKIHKDRDGIPTGLLMEEPAQQMVTEHIPLYTVQQLKRALRQGMRHLHQFGITSIHDSAIGYFRHEYPIIRAYLELEKERGLEIRVYLTVVEEVYRKILSAGLGMGFGSNFLRLGAVKLFQDGSIQALTAALTEPYYGKPGFCGDLIIPQKTLNQLVEKYHSEDIQIAIHANGDRAIESALSALERAQRLYPGKNLRHMIIHCQLASAQHIQRMKRLGIIPSYFVNHIYYWGDRHLKLFLGPERAKNIDPAGSTVQEGLRFTLHTDLPVTDVDPLFSIWCAVNRMTRKGETLGEAERIMPWDALKAYTMHAAHCSFEEDAKGSIEVGKLADFAVLSDNPTAISPNAIKDIKVLQTVVGGRTVFQSTESEEG